MDVTEGLVLDNSVTMSWCFPDEHDPYAGGVEGSAGHGRGGPHALAA